MRTFSLAITAWLLESDEDDDASLIRVYEASKATAVSSPGGVSTLHCLQHDDVTVSVGDCSLVLHDLSGQHIATFPFRDIADIAPLTHSETGTEVCSSWCIRSQSHQRHREVSRTTVCILSTSTPSWRAASSMLLDLVTSLVSAWESYRSASTSASPRGRLASNEVQSSPLVKIPASRILHGSPQQSKTSEHLTRKTRALLYASARATAASFSPKSLKDVASAAFSSVPSGD